MALVGRKWPWSDISFSLRNLPVCAFDSRAQRFSPPLARRRSSCPPASRNLVRTHPIKNCQTLRASAPCLSRTVTLPKGTKLEYVLIPRVSHSESQSVDTSRYEKLTKLPFTHLTLAWSLPRETLLPSRMYWKLNNSITKGIKMELGRGAHTWEHHPQPTIPPSRLNRQSESRRQPVGCISRG